MIKVKETEHVKMTYSLNMLRNDANLGVVESNTLVEFIFNTCENEWLYAGDSTHLSVAEIDAIKKILIDLNKIK